MKIRRKILGKEVRERRRILQMTQKEFAKQAGLSLNTVKLAEGNNCKFSQESTIQTLCDYFNVDKSSITEEVQPLEKECESCGVIYQTYTTYSQYCPDCSYERKKLRRKKYNQERRLREGFKPKETIVPDYSLYEIRELT